MRIPLHRWLWFVSVLPVGTVFAAEPEHDLPQYAVKIDSLGSFITNSMVVSWIVADRLDHLCQGRDAGHEGSSRRSSEPLGMAG